MILQHISETMHFEPNHTYLPPPHAQVASLQTSVSMLQEMFEQQAMGLTTPTATQGRANGIPRGAPSTQQVDFVMLPNHLKTTQALLATPTANHQTTPTRNMTPPTPSHEKGGIINV